MRSCRRCRNGSRWTLALGLALLFPGLALAGWKDGPAPRRESAPAEQGAVQAGLVRPPEAPRSEPKGLLSNLGLLETLTSQTVANAADSLDLPPRSPVTVISTRWHEANWFVANLMADVLARRGHTVRILDLSTPPEPPSTTTPAAPRPGAGQNGPAGGGPRQNPTPLSNPDQDGKLGGEEDEFGGVPGDTTGAYADSIAALEAEDPLWGGGKENAGEEETGPGTSPGAGSVVPSGGAAGPSAGALALSRALTGPKTASLPAGQLVDVRVMEFGIEYSDVSRLLLFGPVRFTRVGGVSLQVAQLHGPGGETERVVMSERHRVDRLSGSDRALVEGASYPFTEPEVQPPSLGRYIEPAVVVAIVSSLVYLFYKNQN